jgi:hypothetical protein
MIVRDMRHLNSPEQLFVSILEHLEIATNAGKVRASRRSPPLLRRRLLTRFVTTHDTPGHVDYDRLCRQASSQRDRHPHLELAAHSVRQRSDLVVASSVV